MLFIASRSIVASLLSVRRSSTVAATAGGNLAGGIKGTVSVSSAFDAGNIDLVEQRDAVRLRIRPDPHTELEDKTHMQWFAFRSTLDTGGQPGATTIYEIENAGDCSFPQAWVGSEVVVSHDRKSWWRVDSTQYDEASGTLSWEWEHTASQPSAYFAYFDLYPYERQLDLVARCAAATLSAPGLQVASIGQTLDGRELDLITVGTGPLSAWVIHRQHPGESQAGFFAEGLLSRLLGLHTGGEVDGLTRRLLEQFTWHVLPSMNPDGASRGHLRTNALGANLNREWGPTGEYAAPTLGRSPEVYHALAKMQVTGVDLFIDVHGDEALPFAFLAGCEGTYTWGPRLEALHGAFVGAYARANPDMQAAFGYEPDLPMKGNLAVASNAVGQRFDALSLTLEMPFKDNAANPRSHRKCPGGGGYRGFDGQRCAMLGASLLDAAAHVAPQLRGVSKPCFPLPDDTYLAPTENQAAIDAHLYAAEKQAAIIDGIIADKQACSQGVDYLAAVAEGGLAAKKASSPSPFPWRN